MTSALRAELGAAADNHHLAGHPAHHAREAADDHDVAFDRLAFVDRDRAAEPHTVAGIGSTTPAERAAARAAITSVVVGIGRRHNVGRRWRNGRFGNGRGLGLGRAGQRTQLGRAEKGHADHESASLPRRLRNSAPVTD